MCSPRGVKKGRDQEPGFIFKLGRFLQATHPTDGIVVREALHEFREMPRAGLAQGVINGVHLPGGSPERLARDVLGQAPPHLFHTDRPAPGRPPAVTTAQGALQGGGIRQPAHGQPRAVSGHLPAEGRERVQPGSLGRLHLQLEVRERTGVGLRGDFGIGPTDSAVIVILKLRTRHVLPPHAHQHGVHIPARHDGQRREAHPQGQQAHQ